MRRSAFTCDPCYSGYQFEPESRLEGYGAEPMAFPEEQIVGCVDGLDVDGNPCWSPPSMGTWLALAAVAAGLYFWSRA